MGPVHSPDDAPRRLVVPADAAGRRLDVWLAETLAIGRRAAARLAERARIDGRRAAKSRRVAAGDVVELPEPLALPDDMLHAEWTVARSAELLVLEKPAGLPTTAIAGTSGPSLAAWLALHYPECAEIGAPGESGLVHRLDPGTSGLVLAARTQRAYESLRAQFRRHEIEKRYLAVVAGVVDAGFVADAPIGRHPKSRRRMRVVAPGSAARRDDVRPARSVVAPLRRLGSATLVEVVTRTGIRHQVRVHLAAAGHPLIGDPLYGGPEVPGADGPLLHASALRWTDPDGLRREATSRPPDAWREIATALGAAREELEALGGGDA